jgi:hypothetical protein
LGEGLSRLLDVRRIQPRVPSCGPRASVHAPLCQGEGAGRGLSLCKPARAG